MGVRCLFNWILFKHVSLQILQINCRWLCTECELKSYLSKLIKLHSLQAWILDWCWDFLWSSQSSYIFDSNSQMEYAPKLNPHMIDSPCSLHKCIFKWASEMEVKSHCLHFVIFVIFPFVSFHFMLDIGFKSTSITLNDWMVFYNVDI